jgi:hypothetical protein
MTIIENSGRHRIVFLQADADGCVSLRAGDAVVDAGRRSVVVLRHWEANEEDKGAPPERIIPRRITHALSKDDLSLRHEEADE